MQDKGINFLRVSNDQIWARKWSGYLMKDKLIETMDKIPGNNGQILV